MKEPEQSFEDIRDIVTEAVRLGRMERMTALDIFQILDSRRKTISSARMGRLSA